MNNQEQNFAQRPQTTFEILKILSDNLQDVVNKESNVLLNPDCLEGKRAFCAGSINALSRVKHSLTLGMQQLQQGKQVNFIAEQPKQTVVQNQTQAVE